MHSSRKSPEEIGISSFFLAPAVNLYLYCKVHMIQGGNMQTDRELYVYEREDVMESFSFRGPKIRAIPPTSKQQHFTCFVVLRTESFLSLLLPPPVNRILARTSTNFVPFSWQTTTFCGSRFVVHFVVAFWLDKVPPSSWFRIWGVDSLRLSPPSLTREPTQKKRIKSLGLVKA